MKRHRHSRMQPDSEGGMDISSLVDICFLLLIYFIVTSVIMPAERDLSMGPPTEEPSGKPIDVEPLWISINASGQVMAGEGFNQIALDADPTLRDLPLLEERLKVYQQAIEAMNEKCMVVIEAHDEVKTQRVVDVLNTLAGLKISNVTFRDYDQK